MGAMGVMGHVKAMSLLSVGKVVQSKNVSQSESLPNANRDAS